MVIAIPARLHSSRLARKLLLAETGKPLLAHTIERAVESKAAMVFVLTEDKEIFDLALNTPGVQAVLTGPAASGTERIANFCGTYNLHDDHVIVNFQGDEPELPGVMADRVAEAVVEPFWPVATLAAPATEEEAYSPSVVKTVLGHDGCALYFSRAPIPHGGPWLKHMGLYAYRVGWLRKLRQLGQTTLHNERLEQLAWLQAGVKIRVVVEDVTSVGIDTRDEYEAFVKRYLDANRLQ